MKRKIFLIPLALILALAVGCGIYLESYYRAEPEALALTEGMEGDLVWAPEDAETSLIFYPGEFRELVIDGGCHAGFGMYGTQDGDGIPVITSEEQIAITAETIAEMVGA